MLLELLTGSGVGAVVGVRHALEPDHFAAVATMIGSERSSLRAALLGIYWGVGHTLAIVVVGAALVLLQAEMPVRASSVVDLMVSLMLVCLGVRAILQAARTSEANDPLHRQRPFDSSLTASLSKGELVAQDRLVVHSGDGVRARERIGAWPLARPLLVGAIHGLAGSGALTALVLATLPSTASRLAYVALFGVGSTLSMAAMSGLLGWPLARFGTHHVVARSIVFAVGVGSAALGVAWGNATLDLF